MDGGQIERINHHLMMADREREGRGSSPALAMIDAQSVSTAEQFPAGAAE
jgi:putative transposase